jgi:hypothetical protein
MYRSITRRLLISRCPTTEQGGRPIRPALSSSLDGHGQEHSAHLPVQVELYHESLCGYFLIARIRTGPRRISINEEGIIRAAAMEKSCQPDDRYVNTSGRTWSGQEDYN